MNKFLKSLKVSAVILGSVCLIAPSSTFASELDSNTEATQVAPQSDLVPRINPIEGGKEHTTREPIVSYRYAKKDTFTYYVWTGFTRVSDDVVAGSSPAKITAKKSIVYKYDVTGDISGLGFTKGKDFGSEVGYELNVEKNRTGYLAHRGYIMVETGTRQKISDLSNKVVAENKYTIRTPQYGSFEIKYIN